MTQTHGDRSGRTFEAWALAAARELDGTMTAPRGDAVSKPGSLSEAIALLLSPRLLGPSEATPDGLPGCHAEGSDPSGEILAALYDAAFGPEVDVPDPAYRIFATVDHEEGRDPSLEAAGVYVGEHKDRLLFSEPSLPLPEVSCSNLADLRRLHARVLSAALRV